MEFDVLIAKDGKVVVEVLDRGQHLCEDIYKVTNRMGTQLSDEELPDCAPTVHETTNG